MKAVPHQQRVAQDKKTEFTEEPAEKISGTIWTPPIMKNLNGSNESPKELKGPYSSNKKSPTDVGRHNEIQVEVTQSCDANDKMGAQYQEYYEYPDDKMDSTGDDITLVKEVYQSSSTISPIKGFENDGSKKTVQTEEISISKTSGKPCDNQTSRRTHQKSVLMNNKRQEYQGEIGTTRDHKSGKEFGMFTIAPKILGRPPKDTRMQSSNVIPLFVEKLVKQDIKSYKPIQKNDKLHFTENVQLVDMLERFNKRYPAYSVKLKTYWKVLQKMGARFHVKDSKIRIAVKGKEDKQQLDFI